MSEPHFDHELDTRGLNCPMPLVKARQAVGKLPAGQILKVLSSDRGSVKDFQGWARVAANIELLGQETVTVDGAETFVHFVQRSS